MRVVIQRVSEASVKIDENVAGEIANGLLILLGLKKMTEKKTLTGYVVKFQSCVCLTTSKGL
jgi:D-aminoacyl-tRNA deacylase